MGIPALSLPGSSQSRTGNRGIARATDTDDRIAQLHSVATGRASASGTQAAAEPGIPQPPVPSSASQPDAIVMPPQIHKSSAQAQPQAPRIQRSAAGGVSV